MWSSSISRTLSIIRPKIVTQTVDQTRGITKLSTKSQTTKIPRILSLTGSADRPFTVCFSYILFENRIIVLKVTKPYTFCVFKIMFCRKKADFVKKHQDCKKETSPNKKKQDGRLPLAYVAPSHFVKKASRKMKTFFFSKKLLHHIF